MNDVPSFFEKYKSTKNQWIAVICVNLGSLTSGTIIAWLSPVIDYLQSDNTSLITGPLTINEISWLGALPHITATVFAILFLIVTDKFGLKISVWISGISAVIGWILIAVTNQIEYLYLARALAGLPMAGVFCYIPLYVSEISDPRIRGRLGANMPVMIYIGVIITLVSGFYLSYTTLHYILMTFPILFVISFSFMPNSPQYCIKKGQLEEARNSLRFYRNTKEDCPEDELKIKLELEKMINFLKSADQHDRLTVQDFLSKESLIGQCIAFYLAFLMVWNGNIVIVVYVSKIFSDSGSNLNPILCSIIIGVVQLFGCTCSTLLIDYIGRRCLLLWSTFLCFISYAIIGIFNYLAVQGVDVNIVNWVPVVGLSIAVFSACAGINPVTVVYVPEVLPPKIRYVCSNIAFSLLFFFDSFAMFLYPLLTDLYEMYTCIWIFSATCFIAFFVAFFAIKDTTGIDLHITK